MAAAHVGRFCRAGTHFFSDSCSTNRNGQQIPDPYQVVGGGCEGEHPAHLLDPAMPNLPNKSDCLEPAETLFDPFAFLLTNRVTVVPCRSGVDGASPTSLGVLRYMRSDVHMPALGNEIPRVITFVGTNCDMMIARNLF